MKWQVPAKTFLLGEYAALAGASALIVTTKPCFELTLVQSQAHPMTGIEPNSPAGRYWSSLKISDYQLQWDDPYQQTGGMGASSGQFLAVYQAACYLNNTEYNLAAMLDTYFQYAWDGKGVRPSGYDVIAQSLEQCVYINLQQQIIRNYPWPFDDISFLLVQTGVKLATHRHLQELNSSYPVTQLSTLVEQAKFAFEQQDSAKLIDAVNGYHKLLLTHHLVDERSLGCIQDLPDHEEILAVKGCGAMGADVLLLIVDSDRLSRVHNQLRDTGWNILATEKDLFFPSPPGEKVSRSDG